MSANDVTNPSFRYAASRSAVVRACGSGVPADGIRAAGDWLKLAHDPPALGCADDLSDRRGPRLCLVPARTAKVAPPSGPRRGAGRPDRCDRVCLFRGSGATSLGVLGRRLIRVVRPGSPRAGRGACGLHGDIGRAVLRRGRGRELMCVRNIFDMFSASIAGWPSPLRRLVARLDAAALDGQLAVLAWWRVRTVHARRTIARPSAALGRRHDGAPTSGLCSTQPSGQTSRGPLPAALGTGHWATVRMLPDTLV